VSADASSAATAPFVPAFTFTSDERAAQDARLHPIIAELWKAGGITWWRNGPEFQALHQRWLTMFSAADLRVIPDYLNMVVAIATTAAGPFVPVDLWPSVPPPVKLSPEGRLAFQVITNTMREGAGVFTSGKVRRNKHYALLIAHMLCWPEEIHTGADLLPDCYPWPFVIKIDEEGTPRLERQDDIRGEGWGIAQRIETALFDEARQADPLPYGTHPATESRRGERSDRRLLAGEVAYRLRQEGVGLKVIRTHPEFVAALSAPDGSIVGKPDTADGVWKIMNAYRQAHNLARPRPRSPTQGEQKLPKTSERYLRQF